MAAQVLMNLGLKLEEVREEVLNLIGHNLPRDQRRVSPGGSRQRRRWTSSAAT